MTPVTALLGALAALTAIYTTYWTRVVVATRRRASASIAPALAPDGTADDARMPGALQTAIGAVTNFFDSLGIGSFATTTALWRATRSVPDRVIPGTLNAGHTIPVIAQAFIFTSIIPVDIVTLFSMIAAAVAGAWFGAGVVARLPRRKVQIGMGGALLGAAALMLMTQLQLFPGGGEALGVRGLPLVVAIAANLVLGALMTLGIGLYAPSMILVSLLGMNPRAAFPIMMGSCAFLMPVGSMRFIRERSYSLRAALGLTLGGLPAVLLAAYVVKELPLYAVRWLVIVVVLYTAAGLLWAALRGAREETKAAEPAVTSGRR
jgi:uncharacterized membrane protein YfcA